MFYNFIGNGIEIKGHGLHYRQLKDPSIGQYFNSQDDALDWALNGMKDRLQVEFISVKQEDNKFIMNIEFTGKLKILVGDKEEFMNFENGVGRIDSENHGYIYFIELFKHDEMKYCIAHKKDEFEI